MVSGKHVTETGTVLDAVGFQYNDMVDHLCRYIFIRQSINPFSSACVTFFQFLALEFGGGSLWAWRNILT